MTTSLHVWSDDDNELYVAESAEQAAEMAGDDYKPSDFSKEDDSVSFTMQIEETKTMAEWVAWNGPGPLATTNA